MRARDRNRRDEDADLRRGVLGTASGATCSAAVKRQIGIRVEQDARGLATAICRRPG
jgi:hypothetical protein